MKKKLLTTTFILTLALPFLNTQASAGRIEGFPDEERLESKPSGGKVPLPNDTWKPSKPRNGHAPGEFSNLPQPKK